MIVPRKDVVGLHGVGVLKAVMLALLDLNPKHGVLIMCKPHSIYSDWMES